MMYGAKKSDSSIVPAKLANKAERSAAEPVEGDDGTKRNAELQSTVRTQSRKAVTQAQACIRGAVNRNKKEKLTALLHHVSIDVLRWAFFNLKKRAAPGVDGLTWADYAAALDRNLTDLHARIHSGAYRALQSRRQYIPKADGKQRQTTEGTPQGSVASPLLANMYLHYVYDLWVEQWRTRHARGDMIVVRYADDTIVGFQHRQDAERFLIDLKERLAKFALSLHPEKTRLLEFGRYAAERRAERGQGKPENVRFPGVDTLLHHQQVRYRLL